MDNNPERFVERLLQISNEKYGVVKDIHLITCKQTGTIIEDGVESLQQLIMLKQEKLDKINLLDEEFNVCFQRLKQELKVNNLNELKDANIAGIKDLKNIIAKIMESIKEISSIEKQNNIKAKNLLNEIGNEIRKISDGKKFNAAYNPTPIRTRSFFIDKKK